MTVEVWIVQCCAERFISVQHLSLSLGNCTLAQITFVALQQNPGGIDKLAVVNYALLNQRRI